MQSHTLYWVLIIGVAGWSVLGCGRRTTSSTAAAGPDEAAPRQTSYDARFIMNQGERPRAAIAAGQMEQYSRGDSTFSLLVPAPDTMRGQTPPRVTAWLFDAEGDSSATLTADSLIYHDARGRFEAFGDVVVTTQSEKRLQSEHLTWDEADRKIRTNRFVRIVTPSERVEGYGLVADEDLDTYQIGRFTAQVTIEDDAASPADTTDS